MANCRQCAAGRNFFGHEETGVRASDRMNPSRRRMMCVIMLFHCSNHDRFWYLSQSAYRPPAVERRRALFSTLSAPIIFPVTVLYFTDAMAVKCLPDCLRLS